VPRGRSDSPELQAPHLANPSCYRFRRSGLLFELRNSPPILYLSNLQPLSSQRDDVDHSQHQSVYLAVIDVSIADLDTLKWPLSLHSGTTSALPEVRHSSYLLSDYRLTAALGSYPVKVPNRKTIADPRRISGDKCGEYGEVKKLVQSMGRGVQARIGKPKLDRVNTACLVQVGICVRSCRVVNSKSIVRSGCVS
jgi:hypothetical protein